MEQYDVVITGAGPAGLMCAASLGLASRRILLLEKNANPAKKLLLSGSGQCNISHGGEIREFSRHYGEHGNFVMPALLAFSNRSCEEFFSDNGLPLKEREDGKIFPATLRASDVVSVLLGQCREGGVKIVCDSPVLSVDRTEAGFMVRTQSGGYSAGAIVIATGGRSYPSTGSTGDGYRFAASLSHAVVPARPALTPLLIRGYPFPSLSGISFASIPFSIWRRGKKIAEHTGDVLLTHKGISGPGILDASREILAGDEVRLSFAGSTSQEAVSADLAAAHDAGTELVRAILLRYQIPDRLTRALLKHAGIAEDMRCAHLTASQRRSVASLATAFPLIVESPGDFSIAMATAGGVALCEINRKTMESKKVPSLYFAGEVIDIDGDTGGYNIQAALSTGALAAHSIAKRWGQDPC